jgi:hypothetical protein
MATAVSLLFDRVLLLNEGEEIIVNFCNENDLKSKRTLLFKEKKLYEERMNKRLVTKGIKIHQEIKPDKQMFRLKLSCSGDSLEWLNDAVVRTKEGDTKLDIMK